MIAILQEICKEKNVMKSEEDKEFYHDEEIGEGVRETLSLVVEILKGFDCKRVAGILEDYLHDDEELHCPIERVNERLDEYINKYLISDISSGIRMVKMGNVCMPLPAINKWETFEKYSYKDKRMEYRILFNATEGHPNMFANVVAIYYDEKERDKDIEKLLEMKLSTHTHLK